MSLSGLRARLTVAFVLVAVLAVAASTVFANYGLEPRLETAARSRLSRSAQHAAGFAAGVYAESRDGWSAEARATLAHLAALDGLRLAIITTDGRRLPAGPPPIGSTAGAPVVVRGERVGSVVISADSGSLLTPEERHLRHSLDLLHLAAAGAATLVGLVVAWFLAETLSRPLRRIRSTAERLERGNVGARVSLSGGDEVRAVGRALNRLAETLEREDQLRRAGVADLAHELRTPVNGLLSRIEAAQDGVLTGPDNLDAMHEEAARLTRLLDDLSRLSDAEQPGLLLDKHRLDLSAVVAASVDSFVPRFADASIELEVNLSSVLVDGDAGRLEQVASNLLSNALRYTEPGGSVTVMVGRDGVEALLEVVDTGIGIAPEDLGHVFTRFWRGDRSRSRQTGGTGIGLAIVHELVQAHDGRVDVDSAPGRGSRFRVWLPTAHAA